MYLVGGIVFIPLTPKVQDGKVLGMKFWKLSENEKVLHTGEAKCVYRVST